MPEMPEVQAIAGAINKLFQHQKIEDVRVEEHIPLHKTTADTFIQTVRGSVLKNAQADGKFLLLHLDNGFSIVVNLMLTGKLKEVRRSYRPMRRDVFLLVFAASSLVYNDRKRMSRVYLVPRGSFSEVVGFDQRGPSALAPTLTDVQFINRIKEYSGQLKSILTKQHFVKGIGNTYADEILLYAGILPFRKRETLNDDELLRLYNAMREVLSRYCDMLLKKPMMELTEEKRSFLLIHGKGGGICPLCGGRISEIRANRFLTNYCQSCQS